MAQPAKIVIPAAVEKRYEIQDEIARWVNVAAVHTGIYAMLQKLEPVFGQRTMPHASRCTYHSMGILGWQCFCAPHTETAFSGARYSSPSHHIGMIARKALQN